MGRPLKIAKAHAVIVITATAATTNIVTTSANLYNIGTTSRMRFKINNNMGGILAANTYWILDILSANTFTLSATHPDENPNKIPVTLSSTSAAIPASLNIVDSGFDNPTGSANTYSVVGGDTNIAGKQTSIGVSFGINGNGTVTTTSGSPTLTGVGTSFNTTLSAGSIVYVNSTALGTISAVANATSATFVTNASTVVTASSYSYAKPEDGFIVRQKGKQKYLVTGTTTGITAPVYTYNTDKANLLPNTCSITATYSNSAVGYVQSLNDRSIEIFTASSGPTATGNIVVANAAPAYATFNLAADADPSAAIRFPVTTITGA